ncbi:MAG: hypothetical protein AB8F95_03000 [Bacteroidia bacterium]
MKNTYFYILLLLIASCTPEPPVPSNPFELTFGGAKDDVANDVLYLDEAFYVFGTTKSKGDENGDHYLLKLDINGKLIWEKSYGGTEAENGVVMTKTSDGNLLLAGSTRSTGSGREDIHLIKVDTAGTVLWEQTHGGSLFDSPDDIIEMTNGEFCIASTTVSFGAGSKDMYLLWTDQNGNLLREKTYGGPDLDGCAEILEIENGELMLHAYTKNYGAVSRDMYLLKMTSEGDSLWSRRFGSDEYEQSESFERRADGGYVIGGHTAGTDPDHNMYSVGFDRDGNQLWEQEYGGDAHDGVQCMLINQQGQYVFVGRSMSFGNGDRGIYMVTTDTEGNLLRADTLGGPRNDWAQEIIEHESFYILAGHSNSFSSDGDDDVYVIKIPSGL